jgi:glycine cleavage system transcriptional repressor
LTDLDPANRPGNNTHHLLIHSFSKHPDSPLLRLARRITDSGCNLEDARLSTLGGDIVVSARASGPWDAIAKLETMLSRLGREDGLQIHAHRTDSQSKLSNLLPYMVEVVAADRPGILLALADFFEGQGIALESVACSRYQAMQTGADMFSAQLTIGIPSDTHIAALRDDFLDFSDRMNLDAILDPIKF